MAFGTSMFSDKARTVLLEKLNQLICQDKFYPTLLSNLSKNVDTIDINILMRNLLHDGFSYSAISFISYLLCSRKYVAELKNETADKHKISIGASLGSILRPLFFLIFMNGFHDCLDIFPM